MGKYYLTDGTYLHGYGECQDGLEHRCAYNGLKVVLGEPPANLPLPPAPEPAYDLKRAAAYPPMGAQLDALWHAMAAGTLPKVEPFYSDIQKVKRQFPKPGSN